MAKGKFIFNSGGRDYIFWAWKGGCLNLGAGAELGIYKRLVINGVLKEHWLVDSTNLTFPMSLKLSYNGEDIIDYNPIDNQWWITGFNPEYKDVAAGELTVIFTVDFTLLAKKVCIMTFIIHGAMIKDGIIMYKHIL